MQMNQLARIEWIGESSKITLAKHTAMAFNPHFAVSSLTAPRLTDHESGWIRSVTMCMLVSVLFDIYMVRITPST